jgi:hypothetical protein
MIAEVGVGLTHDPCPLRQNHVIIHSVKVAWKSANLKLHWIFCCDVLCARSVYFFDEWSRCLSLLKRRYLRIIGLVAQKNWWRIKLARFALYLRGKRAETGLLYLIFNYLPFALDFESIWPLISALRAKIGSKIVSWTHWKVKREIQIFRKISFYATRQVIAENYDFLKNHISYLKRSRSKRNGNEFVWIKGGDLYGRRVNNVGFEQSTVKNKKSWRARSVRAKRMILWNEVDGWPAG